MSISWLRQRDKEVKMTTKACKKSGKTHTPIKSEIQRGLFGAELARRRAGKEGSMPGITQKELVSHLKESKGKSLPEMVKKSTKGSPSFTSTELSQGYRKL